MDVEDVVRSHVLPAEALQLGPLVIPAQPDLGLKTKRREDKFRIVYDFLIFIYLFILYHNIFAQPVSHPECHRPVMGRLKCPHWDPAACTQDLIPQLLFIK